MLKLILFSLTLFLNACSVTHSIRENKEQAERYRELSDRYSRLETDYQKMKEESAALQLENQMFYAELHESLNLRSDSGEEEGHDSTLSGESEIILNKIKTNQSEREALEQKIQALETEITELEARLDQVLT